MLENLIHEEKLKEQFIQPGVSSEGSNHCHHLEDHYRIDNSALVTAIHVMSWDKGNKLLQGKFHLHMRK